ncbi:MmcQ/YjbR family DNA-binding protein [Nocardia yamanashiensis]|uniref:MmcQ/YjbR family DNA-binding protein n=1 Tax=Nocardia yamanashiensis TaxID=209247 RepID=UPI001E62DD64|nr:MmcQ/YjbR family DNA-binding protein [Nocardia yamanashiensis]UGT44385.1 MmcQ/YjbR family DNA-binding protein [Nocardia yamanashiensis]
MTDVLEPLRALCLALPEVTERLSHGEPTWFVRGKKTFVMFSNEHHGGRLGFWCAAPPGVQEELVGSVPERFFRPPYVGHRGWLGVGLDVAVDWAEIAEIVEDAYRMVAPKTLVAQLDSAPVTARDSADPGSAPDPAR